MPGRIIQAVQQAGTNNPLIMLDEIDKVGADFRGDPSSALLEVLDPEQNNSFRDNYLGVTFDLSNVIFMTTANVLDTIQPALRDRMEVIRIAGYTEEEKREIAIRHLIPKQMEENGITPRDLHVSRTALIAIIQQYTQEAGLRQLEREISRVCRKVARKIAEGHKGGIRVSLKNVHEFLGAPKIIPEEILKKDQIGVATGLAWTAVGGDILFIEALRMKGKGNLVLTGQLGDVMRESAQARHRGRRFQQLRFAHSHPGGRDSKGRTIRGHHFSNRHGFSAFGPACTKRRRHDGRDHTARKRFADWRRKRKSSCSPASSCYNYHSPAVESTGSG
jgi:ATP-dependent Lon protease